ncbi:DUF6906 family protein (plasmid) [Aneurinibacillus thermoaerophilus]|uniref:DUF6906 family protein n=1 Tax=Aneurinibacillus thermoaerophilus TaxID=143495 RepID=UPI0038CFD35F
MLSRPYRKRGRQLKNGKNPKRKQKLAISKACLNPDNWLITKSLPNELHIVHRETGTKRIIPA